MNNIQSNVVAAFHPGYYVNEIIEALETTQKEYAKRLEVSEKILSQLINGQTSLSKELALKLSLATNISIGAWLNLQMEYERRTLEEQKEQELKTETAYLKILDYKYFVNNGFVLECRSKLEQVKNLLKFLNIASFAILEREDFLVCFRTATSRLALNRIICSNAWVQIALNEALKIETDVYSEKKLRECLPKIRKMSSQSPQDFLPELRQICNRCGIALVLLPHLKNSGVNGATKWITNEKAMIAINARGKDADKFWFSFMHEIYHVLEKRVKKIMIAGEGERKDYDEALEKKCDNLSSEFWIPDREYRVFVHTNKGRFTENAIRRFSTVIDVHPGIVVGRLQHDKEIDFNQLNSLKEKYEIVVK